MSIGSRQKVWAYIRLGRPHFLAGGILMYGVGTVAARSLGFPFDGIRFLLGQLLVTTLQFGAQFANEYHDLAADRANQHPTFWSGGSRILAQGLLAPQAAKRSAFWLWCTSLLVFLLTLQQGASGRWFAPLVGMAALLSWGYSAPPLRLQSRGWGELTVGLLVGGLTPVLAFYLQAGVVPNFVLISILPLWLVQSAMLLAIELPDADGDRMVGKRTLVVRLGEQRAARLHALLLLSAFVVSGFSVLAGVPFSVALVPLIIAPLAAWQAERAIRFGRSPDQWERIALRGVALVFLMGVAQFAGWVTAG
jgi:1,4-dihydroxy-2-naphthoate polyprenyltransferase